MDVTEEQVSVKGDRKLVKPAIYAGLVIIVALFPLFITSSFHLHLFILTFIYIIVASSWRTIAISGQMSLGHAGFMGIGAYASAILAIELGWTPWLTMPLGGFVAMAIAFIVGYPFTRLRAIYFAMVSLFFGAWLLYLNSVLSKWTGGFTGLMGIPPVFTGPDSRQYYFYFFLGLTVLSLLVLRRLEICRIGTTWKAIAQSYLVASSVGINEARQRILILAVGSFFAGLAGAGYAHYSLLLAHTSFNVLASIYMVIYVFVGGIGSFAGPIVGTAVLILIPEYFSELKEFVPFLYAGILLIVVYTMPQGLAGLPEQIITWVRGRREGKGVTRAS